jgi:hypothetical protein
MYLARSEMKREKLTKSRSERHGILLRKAHEGLPRNVLCGRMLQSASGRFSVVAVGVCLVTHDGTASFKLTFATQTITKFKRRHLLVSGV